jgi:hypothetical protein
MFSQTTIDAIKSYVYALVDDKDIIFYIGKGEGNRVFDHIEEVRRHLKGKNELRSIDSMKNQDDTVSTTSPKREKIAAMLQKGHEPKKYIIREGLTPEQALLIEAALISVLDWQLKEKLTNQVAGHGTAHFGLKTAEELEATRGEPFLLDDLPNLAEGEEVVAINVNRRWKEVVRGEASLIAIAQGRWRINVTRARECKYAIIHANGIVRGVFEIACWSDRGTDGRCTFTPKYSTPMEDQRFRNKNASSLFGEEGNRAQYPIKYIRKTAGNINR